MEPLTLSSVTKESDPLAHPHSRVVVRAWASSVSWPGLTSPFLVHDGSRDVFLRHFGAVVVHFGLWPGHLRGVVAVDGDAGVGAGFSGATHDVGKRSVCGRVEMGLLSGSGELIV